MGPTRHRAPGRIPAQLAPLLLLLLLLRLPSMRGDCSLPPDVPNAQPDLRGLSSFPQDTTITYKCSEGFVKVPSLPDSIVCLESEWSEIAEFCNRSCAVPPRLLFAALKKIYSKQNYFPAGSTVEYECRMGYKRDPRLSGQLTCLQDFAWSKPVEFCKKKSCPNPGEIKNGHINITTDILFGASIFFSCNTGYKLEGETSSYCSLADNTVRWSHPLPECKEIHCPDPPEIANGTIQEPQTTYVYQQSVTYRCAKGFQLVGGSSIYCTMKGDQPAWSSPVPACKESSQISKVTPAVQKPTTVTAPGTKPKPTPHKPTPASAPGTKPKPTHQKPTSANAPVKQSPAAPKATTRVHTTSTAKGQGPPPSGANNIAVGKFGSPVVKRNCLHCGKYNPYSWKNILSFRCLRNTIKMQCLWVPKRKQVNAFYRHVLWKPMRTGYIPKYSRPCSCSKVILGQLQVTWPISRVSLRASCMTASS